MSIGRLYVHTFWEQEAVAVRLTGSELVQNQDARVSSGGQRSKVRVRVLFKQRRAETALVLLGQLNDVLQSAVCVSLHCKQQSRRWPLTSADCWWKRLHSSEGRHVQNRNEAKASCVKAAFSLLTTRGRLLWLYRSLCFTCQSYILSWPPGGDSSGCIEVHLVTLLLSWCIPSVKLVNMSSLSQSLVSNMVTSCSLTATKPKWRRKTCQTRGFKTFTNQRMAAQWIRSLLITSLWIILLNIKYIVGMYEFTRAL